MFNLNDVNEEIHKMHWDKRAIKYGTNSLVTSKDTIQFGLENDVLIRHINKKEKIFDVGCGNGATLKTLLDSGLKPIKIGGCDISEKMISIAKKILDSEDLYVIDLKNDEYDKIFNFSPTVIIHKRVLHNLGGRKDQRHHLKKLSSVLPSGCKLLLISAFWEGLLNLNILRNSFGLKPIMESEHNDYSRLSDVKEVLNNNDMNIIKHIDYSSTYYIGSRILQPFLYPMKEPSYEHEINRIFSRLPNIEGFGLHHLIIAEKR